MAEKTTYFSKGQTVYSHLFPTGYGVIENIYPDQVYPLHVRYQLAAGGTSVEYLSFALDGRRDYCIVLSQNPIQLIKNKPITIYGDMDLVWVRDNESEPWLCKYYCKYEKERHYCYDSQSDPKKTYISYWAEVFAYDKRPF